MLVFTKCPAYKFSVHRFFGLVCGTTTFLLTATLHFVAGHRASGILLVTVTAVIIAIFSNPWFLESDI